MNYNLLEEHWIPVLYHDGRWERVGIRKALGDASRIRQIAASNPMDRVAILRFLLAVLYWCKGDPPTGAISGDSFPLEWFSKLDQNRDCFNLLGEGKRFYQYKRDGDAVLTANYLIHEVPTGSNHWHFRHSADKINGLCRACCAMGLLRLPLFSTSGGRGKPPGINAKPPIYFTPMGTSLGATLRHSWRQIPELGIPAWEQPDIGLPKSGRVHLLTGLTWLPRRVWLGDLGQDEARCVACGRLERLILTSVFAPIGSTKTEGGVSGRIWSDPHVIYEKNKKGEVMSLHASNALGAADAAVGQWSRIMAGIIQEPMANQGRGTWIVGFSTVQNDKYLEAMEFATTAACAQSQIEESMDRIRKWQKEVWRAQQRVKETLRLKRGTDPTALIRPHVEAKVSAHAGEIITGKDEAWQQAAEEYKPFMRALASTLRPGVTTAAVEQRRKIASVIPDMRPRTEASKTPGPRKGGTGESN